MKSNNTGNKRANLEPILTSARKGQIATKKKTVSPKKTSTVNSSLE